ncbi:MAG: STAS domain-containing protein [Planctomycetota bacterium]
MSQSELTGIPLAGSVGVAQVAELYATVTEVCATEAVIAFDCSETRDIDASIVQLLLAVQAAAEQKGSKMELRGASDTLAELFGEYGLGDCLTVSTSQKPPRSSDSATNDAPANPAATADEEEQ